MEWKEVRLESLVNRKICYGIVQAGSPLQNGVPIVKVQNIVQGLDDLSSLDKTSEDISNQYKRTILKGGELLITLVGTVGLVDVAPKDFAGANIIRNVGLLDITDNNIKQWVKYYIKTRDGQHYIMSNLNTTVQKALNIKELCAMPIPMPNECYMQKAVSILSSLDRKIELNNKINAQLEEMAQAIFKSWFVDFEPFKDGKFVESELGMIPEGWRVGCYNDIIEGTISGDWGKEDAQGNYTHEVACVRGCDFQDINNGVRGKTPQRFILEKNYLAKRLIDKDILVEISGGTATVSTGRISLVSEELLKKYNYDIVCTNFCKVVRPINAYSAYIYYSWQYKYDNRVMFGYENGTSGLKNFAIKDFLDKELVLIPREEDLTKFQAIIEDLQKKKQLNGTECINLSQLRDTLLPKLMSGEIDLDEIEKTI